MTVETGGLISSGGLTEIYIMVLMRARKYYALTGQKN